MRDLMPGAQASLHPASAPKAKTPGSDRKATVYPTADQAIAALEDKFGPRSHLWTYRNTSGDEIGMVLRWPLPPAEPGGKPQKRVLPVSKTKDGWANVSMPAPRPLFDLPRLLKLPAGSTVIVVEGEPCVDAARAIGFFAITSAHGSDSAERSDWNPLRGMDVIILPDNDKAGNEYADRVAELAIAAGARSVKIVPLPGLGEHQDLVHFLVLHGGDAEAARAHIESLAAAAEHVTVEATLISAPSEPEWQHPQPLQARGGAFPINDAFPQSLGPIRDYCRAIGEAFQVPVDIDVFLGRYDGLPNVQLYNKSHDGSPHRTNRVNRSPIKLRHPLLSIGFVIQPEAVRDFLTNRKAKGTGLVARFGMSLPTSMLGERAINTPGVPLQLKAVWRNAVRRLMCYLFLTFTGLRRSEAAQIRWLHVHLDALNCYVELPPSITKSGKPEAVPLIPELASALRAHRGNAKDKDLVFDEIPSMWTFRLDLAAAKIEEQDTRGRKVVLHSLRHSLATLLAVSGVPMVIAQKILRHRDIKLTAEVYTDEGLLPLSAAMQALPSLNSPTIANGPKVAREA